MSIRRKPSYFDDDYDERMSSKRRFTFKSFLQLIAYFIVVIFKAISNFAVSFREKHPIDEIIQSNRRRRRLTLGLVVLSLFIFSIMIGTVLLAVNNENAKIAKFNNDAGAVCAEYIKNYGTTNYENMYYTYGIASYQMSGLCYAREMDFNNDGKSELLICYCDSGTYQAEIWGYDGDDFVQLYHCKAAQTKKKADGAWITIYRHNNRYYIGVHSKNLKNVSLFGMKGNEFDKKYTATYDPQSEVFTIRNKVDYTSFERIKLSVIREEKASVVVDTVSSTIDGFKLDSSEPIKDEKKVTRENVYAEIIAEYRQNEGAPSLKTENGATYIDGLALVKQVDLDGDGKNELILCYRNATKIRDTDNNGDYISIIDYKYTTEVYTFKDKKAKLIFEKEDASQKEADEFDKYLLIQNAENSKHNLCFNNYSSTENGHIVTATSMIFEYDGKTVEPIYKSKFITDYGYKEYYIDDEEVWSSKFEEEGYEVPFFDGSGVYSSTAYEVLYLQRSAGNSESVKTQFNETESTINKLIK